MFPKYILKKKKKFPLKLTQTHVKLQKIAKHLWWLRFTVKRVSVVSGGQFLFPVGILIPLMSLLFWEITHGIKILCL